MVVLLRGLHVRDRLRPKSDSDSEYRVRNALRQQHRKIGERTWTCEVRSEFRSTRRCRACRMLAGVTQVLFLSVCTAYGHSMEALW